MISFMDTGGFCLTPHSSRKEMERWTVHTIPYTVHLGHKEWKSTDVDQWTLLATIFQSQEHGACVRTETPALKELDAVSAAPVATYTEVLAIN